MLKECQAMADQLCERAVLVDFSCKTWDRLTFGADTWKKAGRRFHYDNTFSGLSRGWRILPAINYERYMRVMTKYKQGFTEAATKACQYYPEWLREQKQKLKSEYKEADYPDEAEIWEKFKFEFAVMPLAAADDIRAQLSEEHKVAIQRDHEERLARQWEECTTHVWHILYQAVKDISVRLTRYNNKEQTRFWDTIIGNALKACERVPRLNIAGDKNLEDLAEEVKQRLCIFDPKDLRGKSPQAEMQRDLAIMEAEDLLEKIRPHIK